MKSASYFIAATLVSAIGLAGCNNGTTRSEYPDNSNETKAQAEAIRDDSQRRNAAIDVDVDQRLTALAFRNGQIEKKASQEREQIAIDLSKDLQPLKAKQDEAKAKSERDIEGIEKDAEAKRATLSGEEANRVKAEADVKKAEATRAAAEVMADQDAKIIALKTKSAKRVTAVDDGEAVEKAGIVKERAEVERQGHERKLAISVDTNAKLDELGQKSAKRQDVDGKKNTELAQQDQRITADIKKGIELRGESARGVTVTTNAGVVVLTGKVTDPAIKNHIVTDAGKIKGVVRVDDHIAVH